MTYHLYDPGDCDSTQHASIADAMKAGNDLIAIYRDQCDPEWPEYVEGIAIYEGGDEEDGKMVARSVTCDRIDRPDDVDEDGYSPSLGICFYSTDFYCDYKMELANV